MHLSALPLIALVAVSASLARPLPQLPAPPAPLPTLPALIPTPPMPAPGPPSAGPPRQRRQAEAVTGVVASIVETVGKLTNVGRSLAPRDNVQLNPAANAARLDARLITADDEGESVVVKIADRRTHIGLEDGPVNLDSRRELSRVAFQRRIIELHDEPAEADVDVNRRASYRQADYFAQRRPSSPKTSNFVERILPAGLDAVVPANAATIVPPPPHNRRLGAGLDRVAPASNAPHREVIPAPGHESVQVGSSEPDLVNESVLNFIPTFLEA